MTIETDEVAPGGLVGVTIVDGIVVVGVAAGLEGVGEGGTGVEGVEGLETTTEPEVVVLAVVESAEGLVAVGLVVVGLVVVVLVSEVDEVMGGADVEGVLVVFNAVSVGVDEFDALEIGELVTDEVSVLKGPGAAILLI